MHAQQQLNSDRLDRKINSLLTKKKYCNCSLLTYLFHDNTTKQGFRLTLRDRTGSPALAHKSGVHAKATQKLAKLIRFSQAA